MSTDAKTLLTEKRETLLAGGGSKKTEDQHAKGKLTARERLTYLLDEDTFQEFDLFVTHRSTLFDMANQVVPADGVVAGSGKINGRLVFVYSQDFTVMGGSLGEMHAQKISKVMDMALKVGAPVIGLNDSGGARIQEGVDALSGFGHIFYRNVQSSGVIPQITAIMGPCAGGAVYSPALTDFIFMTEKSSYMFITGPQVIKEVTGEEITSAQLGGAITHNNVSGVAHFVYPSDEELLDGIKHTLSYIPQNNREEAPLFTDYMEDPSNAKIGSIIPVGAKSGYDVKSIITALIDSNSFFEVQAGYAKNMVVGFGRLGGKSIGIIANQPSVLAGCIEINASDKAARFIRFCDAFNIPVLTLVDVPGFLPGVSQETGGIIRHGAKLLYAYSEATVPLLTVILRKAYGGAYIGMASRELGADVVLAWPNAEIAVMGAEGAASIIFRKEISESKDPGATRNQKIEDFKGQFANPYHAASRGYVDDIVLPEETRERLISSLEMLQGKQKLRVARKHGNFPV